MKFCCSERMKDKIDTFCLFGDTGNGGITRLSLSKEAIAARAEFKKRMEALGAIVVTDDLANMYATIQGDEDLPAIMSGSHLDSVVKGGNYDGVLGVLAAMEAAETIVRDHIPHRHPITVVVWTNEEGARFEPAMMSSGVICGKFDNDTMLRSEAKDIPGYTFKDALLESGFMGDIGNRMSPEKYIANIELHAEQGPVLYEENKDIGIVVGVVGMVNYEFRVKGQADHAGTTPMMYRKDALYAAVQALEYIYTKLGKLDEELVYTIGKIAAYPNIHTIIPEEVKMTIDSRHRSPEVLKQVISIIENVPEKLAGCTVEAVREWDRKTVDFDKRLVSYVEKSADKLGYSSKRMYSGAGHDSQYICELVPTAMIFVPSDKGHSHCELEYTPLENCLKGANVLLNTILEIDRISN